jgi:hypothetical protein
MADLAVFYEHPQWFEPLFEVLDRRGVDWAPVTIQDHTFDPAADRTPAPVILNRLAMSSFLRQSEHALFYSLAVLDHWEGLGARVINGTGVLAYDTSKARQLALFARAGLDIPTTRADLEAAVADGLTPESVDGVVLAQQYVAARDARVFRCEVLNGKLLYAIALDGAGSTFDLCPADVCRADKPTITMTAFTPPAAITAAVERVALAAGLDVGGVEYMIDDADGRPKFYDLNAMSNFVGQPMAVLGFDPHEIFVDYLVEQIAAPARAAA